MSISKEDKIPSRSNENDILVATETFIKTVTELPDSTIAIRVKNLASKLEPILYQDEPENEQYKAIWDAIKELESCLVEATKTKDISLNDLMACDKTNKFIQLAIKNLNDWAALVPDNITTNIKELKESKKQLKAELKENESKLKSHEGNLKLKSSQVDEYMVGFLTKEIKRQKKKIKGLSHDIGLLRLTKTLLLSNDPRSIISTKLQNTSSALTTLLAKPLQPSQSEEKGTKPEQKEKKLKGWLQTKFKKGNTGVPVSQTKTKGLK